MGYQPRASNKKARAKERDQAMKLFAKHAHLQGFSMDEVREGLARWFGGLHELPVERQQEVINGSPYRDPPDNAEARLIRKLVLVERQLRDIERKQRRVPLSIYLGVILGYAMIELIGWLF